MKRDTAKTERQAENDALREYFRVEICKLADNIRSLREAYGETQIDLANVVHVVKATISQYETGKRVPDLLTLMAIAHHYGLTVERLIYGDYDVKILNDKIPLRENETHENRATNNQKTLNQLPSNMKNANKILWETILEIMVSDQALANEHFRRAYEYHCQTLQALIEGKGFWDRYTINKQQELYNLAIQDHILEAVVNMLWWPMCESISTSIQTNRLRENYSRYSKNTPALTILKETIMPTLDDLENPEFEEAKSTILDSHRLVIYDLIRILKQVDDIQYRNLADYYTALMYRFDFRTESLSSEESYAIGSELLTMGAIMENPYAKRYLLMFEEFRNYNDDDDESEDN